MGPDQRDVFFCLPPCLIFFSKKLFHILWFHISIHVGGLSYYYPTTIERNRYVYSQVYWNWNADCSWIRSLYLGGRLHKNTAFRDLTFAHQDKTNHILLLILIEPSLGHRYQSCHWYGCHFSSMKPGWAMYQIPWYRKTSSKSEIICTCGAKTRRLLVRQLGR